MLKQSVADHVIEKALNSGADFCEIFAEDRKELTLKYSEQKCNSASKVNIYGAGIYLLRGKSSVYVYTSDLSENGLMKLVGKGTQFLGGGNEVKPINYHEQPVAEPNPIRVYPGFVDLKSKVRVLEDTDRYLRSAIKADYYADYSYIDMEQNVVIASSDGTWAEDQRVTTRLRNRFTVSNGKDSIGTFIDFVRPMGFEAFESGEHMSQFSQEVGNWVESLSADESPRGRFPVVFEGGDCVGTFFHEACGHQLETANMQAENAFFRDKLGKKVASEKVTLIDDGTLLGMYGSSKYDDEGMPRQKNVLIEKGILKSFLVDRLGSRQFNVPRTGSGRRENYTFAPVARMSNTYLQAGDDDPDEMIREIDRGILVVGMGGGTGGEEFTLECPRSFLIKNGKVDRLLKNTMLVGRGDETLMKIDRVSNQMVWEKGGAFCGALSGLVNTTTSGARMRVTEMIVG